MTPGELRQYIHDMEVEVERLEEYVFDIALFSEGAISVSELLGMPMPKIRKFEERLSEKVKAEAGKKGTE